MSLHNNLSWAMGIFAFVVLFAGGSYVHGSGAAPEFELVPFSELTNDDVGLIISVKAEMQAARIQTN